MTFGERLQSFRKQANLTQKQLSQKCGLAVINISQYERNIYTPKPEAGKKLATALGVSVSDLYGWSEFDSDQQHIESLSAGVKMLDYAELSDPEVYSMLCEYYQLNEAGRKKITDYVKDISKISDYWIPEEDFQPKE